MNRYMDYILSIPKAIQETGQPALPPGYRFHPTDEELIVFYLSNKVADSSFTVAAIADADLNKCEPWELPEKAKMGEKEWYFFCLKDRKYPSGMRTNRATEAGYWKATGKDREVTSSRHHYTVGMKKTLVFYKGRAPKGEKTNWIMHEYRLEGASPLVHLSKAMKDEWVVCRVFRKNLSGKKMAASDTKPEFSLPALLESPRTVAGGDESGVTDSEASGFQQFDIMHLRNPYPSMKPADDPSVWASRGKNPDLAAARYPDLLFNDQATACFNRSRDDQIQQPLGDSCTKPLQNIVAHELAMPTAIPASGSLLNALLEQYNSNQGRPSKIESHIAGTISPEFFSKNSAWTSSFASHQIPAHMISPATFNGNMPASSRLQQLDANGHSYFNDYPNNMARSVTDQLRPARHDNIMDNLLTPY